MSSITIPLAIATTTPLPPGSNATTTSLPALTTPFVQPSGCANIFSTTSWTTSTGGWAGPSWAQTITLENVTVAIAIADSENPAFTPCQPPGWADAALQSRFSFSPAVCPSGWIAYDVDKQSATGPVTTAYCCASGFMYSWPYWLQVATLDGITGSSACFNSVPPTSTTTTMTLGPEELFPNDIWVHKPYAISWREADKTTLSPTPPDITCTSQGGAIPTWNPGTGQLADTVCDDNANVEHDSPYLSQLVLVGIIVPTVVGVLLIACCGFCIYRLRKKKGPEHQAMMAAGGPEAYRQIEMERRRERRDMLTAAKERREARDAAEA